MNARQLGFTLIEILVAVVILAFGLLGIAGLQLSGVRATQSSAQRSTAVAVMNEVAEKIHSNQPGAKLGRYHGFDTNNSATYNGSCTSPSPAPAICAMENGGTAPTGCSELQLATYDRFVLACGVLNGGGTRVGGIIPTTSTTFGILPGGRIAIQCMTTATPGVLVAMSSPASACPAGLLYQIRVSWTDRGDLYQPTGTSGTSYTNTTGATSTVLTVQMTVQP